MSDRLQQAVHFLQQKTDRSPRAGIILGSGLGGLVHEIDIQAEVPYAEIPHFPVSTVAGHTGRLIFGMLQGVPVMAMQGRFHYYEGYSMQEVTFPVRVMKAMGVQTLMVSNAAGGMNPDFRVGDLMLIRDHINLFPDSPLRGKNDDTLGPRFPDMSHTYNRDLIDHAIRIGKSMDVHLHTGVYAGVSGPCFETPAEYRYLRIIGADAVGMSTVPEVIVGVHSGLKCFGISVITDLGVEGVVSTVSHQEVLDAAAKAEKKMTAILKELVVYV